MSDDRPSDPLVTPIVLSAQLTEGDPPPTVLDVRWRLGGPPGAAEHAAGHVPGAVYVNLDRDLADPPGPRGRHPLPDPERFAAAMRAAGVSRERPVVVYDGAGGGAAARAWWLLRHHGHDAVAVLDGGWEAWVEAGLPVEGGKVSADDGDFVAGPGRLPVLDADAAARIAREGVLLDARAPERFRGEIEPVDPVAGRIPGARNLPAAATVDADGQVLPAERLRELVAAAGAAEPGEPGIGVYCGSGVTAAQVVLALEVAGLPGAALYPGSWSEWVSEPGRPVEQG